MQRAAEAARRQSLLDQKSHDEEMEQAPGKTGIGTKIATGVAIGAAIVGGPTLVDQMNGPEFSDQTTTYTVEQGDGLQDAAEAVIGSNQVDIRDVTAHIESQPVNIDALKDGLQPGESIVIPTSVEP